MRTLLLLICLLTTTAFSTPAAALRLHDGDLLFVTAGDTGLSGAIDQATAKAGAPSFDHVGLLAHADGLAVVLHADEQGSRQQTLAGFLDAARARHRQVLVYRLERRYRDAIPGAIAQARRMLGKPYNVTYVQDEDSYYCSDFIERAFRARRVFALQPMNFKDPRTGQMPAYWTAFYRSKGMDVPQDLPGTNPNDMARSPALRYAGRIE